MSTSIARPTIRAVRRSPLTMVLLVGLFSYNASAQVWVTDTYGNAANKAGFASQLAKTVQQYSQQVQSYMTQVQQYQQMLTTVTNLGTNLSITPNTMSKINAGPLIQANCGNDSSGIVGNLLNQVTSLVNQSIAKSQQAICAQIISTQVDKYNITADIANQLQSNIPALEKLQNISTTFTNAGQSSSATTQAANVAAQMAAAMNNWKTRIDADDATIKSLQDVQSTLAQTSLRGTSLQGEAVQAAALTAAFTIQ